MNRFYQRIIIRTWGFIYYEGIVLVGVSFRDQKGLPVKSKKERYKNNWGDVTLESTSTSLVCGTDTGTSSGWLPVGGPIKGFYIVKNGEDLDYDYISDFGVYVEDPCQAVDNTTQKIGLNPTHTSIKDLRYHAGTNSPFWLAKVC